MTMRAICWLGFLVGGLAALPAPASAHRVDEYLQATRVDIRADRIGLEIDLTPGASIAAQVVQQIDLNRDGYLSDDERSRYLRKVVSSLVVSLDGHMLTASLASHEFPTLDAMAAGTGTIRVRAAAQVMSGMGRHQLVYRNAPLNAASVYLVNALIPADARVRLGSPHRDPTQRELAIGFDVAPDEAAYRTTWITIALALLSMLVALRYARSHGYDFSRARRALSNA